MRSLRSLTVLASVAASLSVATALAAQAAPSHNQRNVAGAGGTRPPIPRVSTLGTTRSATLVSYCWTRHLADGGGQGTCADGIPGRPAHILRWRPGTTVRVDLRLPAHGVQVQAARFGTFGSRPSHVVRVKVARSGAHGRRWTFRLPRGARGDTDLLISALFADGDIEAEIGLHVAPVTSISSTATGRGFFNIGSACPLPG